MHQNYRPGSYNTSLPASPERPDSNNFVTTRPGIRLDLGPMNEFLPLLIDVLVTEIQNNCERNAARVFAFNFWGHNRFMNQNFAELIGHFAAHCDLICYRQRANPVDVINGEGPFFVNAAVSYLVDNFQELLQYLPQEAGAAIASGLRDWHALSRDIQTAQAQQQRASFGGNRMGGGAYGGGAGYNPGGGYAPQNVNVRPSWETNAAPQYTGREAPAVKGFNGAAVIQQGSGQYRPSTSERERTVIVPERELETRPAPSTAVLRDERPKVVMPKKTGQAAVTSTEKPVNTAAKGRAFDRTVLNDGSLMVPAILHADKPEAAVQWSPTNQPVAFDRKTSMLFHHVAREDGPTGPRTVITEVIQPRNPGMDYLQHEIDERLKKIYRVNQGQLAKPGRDADLGNLRRIIPGEEGNMGFVATEKQRETLDVAKAPRTITKPIVADSYKEALAIVQLECMRNGYDSTSVEFTLREVAEQCFEDDALLTVHDLRRATSYEDLLEKLVQYGLEHPDGKLFDIITERLTHAFNRFMNKSMYFTWTIDNLVEDYADAKELVRKDNGEQVLKFFERSYVPVIARALDALSGDEFREWFDGHFSADDWFSDLNNPVVFVNAVTDTTVPYTMYELEKRFRLEGLVTKDNASALYDGLEAIFLRTTDPSLRGAEFLGEIMRDRAIVTEDNKMLYARRAYLSPEMRDFNVTLEPLVIIPPREARF